MNPGNCLLLRPLPSHSPTYHRLCYDQRPLAKIVSLEPVSWHFQHVPASPPIGAAWHLLLRSISFPDPESWQEDRRSLVEFLRHCSHLHYFLVCPPWSFFF